MMGKLFQVRRSMALASLAAAFAIGGALTGWVVLSTHAVLGANNDVTLRIASVNAAEGSVNFNEGFSSVVTPLLPMVVNISTSKIVKSPRNQLPFFNDPFFRQFFGDQGQTPRERREHSLGSGVIVNPDGYILTNNHVIDGASDVQVTLSDKRTFKANVVGADPRSDIAVLKVSETKLPSMTLGNSSKTRVGDIVLAVGDPFGIGETVTMGIVSATGRKGLGIEGPEGYEDFIQTDAAINPGNSGGALVNTRGELIGINTAIITGGGGGVGFAIPIDMARSVMDQIVKSGRVTRGYIGVGIQEVTPDLAKAFGVSSSEGALIGSVAPDGPGAKADLQKGDIITSLNDQTISDYRDLRLRISQMAPGTTVRLVILRAGQKREVAVTLAEYPEKAEAMAGPAPAENAMEGVQVETLTPDIARQLNLSPNARGVIITDIDPDGPSAEAGLQRGDIIQEVDRKAVSNMNEFQTAVREAGKKPLLLLVNRGGNTRFVVIPAR